MENITDDMIQNLSPWNDGIKPGDITKTVKESACEQAYQVSPRYLNAAGRLFGGDLLSWIDLTGALAAKRHCNMPVSTVAIDNIHFAKPLHIGDIAILISNVTHVGNSTMEVRVNSYVEDLATGHRSLVNTAYLVYVALKDEKPSRVPRLIPETDIEKREWFAGEKRNEIRKSRRKEGI
ncbi:MAG: acyl-CoA thioesterase [Lachnoanaerobaculum sp.]|nr:acyl-CoA thioesterase [Lachnoanaerobaculum sp.]